MLGIPNTFFPSKMSYFALKILLIVFAIQSVAIARINGKSSKNKVDDNNDNRNISSNSSNHSSKHHIKRKVVQYVSVYPIEAVFYSVGIICMLVWLVEKATKACVRMCSRRQKPKDDILSNTDIY